MQALDDTTLAAYAEDAKKAAAAAASAAAAAAAPEPAYTEEEAMLLSMGIPGVTLRHAKWILEKTSTSNSQPSYACHEQVNI